MKNLIDNKIKSYIWIYWIVWAFITLLILYLKYIYFKGHEMSFKLMVSYAIVLWIPIMFLNMYEGYRLSGYVEKIYPTESENIKNFFGKMKPEPFWSFVNEKSLEDTMLRQLSNNYKKFIMFAKFVFCAIGFLMFSFTIIH